MRLYQVAQAIVGVAFMPDAMDDAKKKTEADLSQTD